MDEPETEEEQEATKEQEHYFTEKPKSKKTYGLIVATIRGAQYEFITCSGVFSHKAVDKGTFLLAESMQVPEEADVLDLGCGYGVIGVVAAGLTKGKVLFSDVNYRAVSLAKRNIGRNSLENAEARKSSFFENIPEKFDVILLNPPFTAGMDIVFKLLEDSKQHLNPNGTIQIVARHQKGGARLEEKLMELFGNCEAIAKASGYRVYISRLK